MYAAVRRSFVGENIMTNEQDPMPGEISLSFYHVSRTFRVDVSLAIFLKGVEKIAVDFVGTFLSLCLSLLPPSLRAYSSYRNVVSLSSYVPVPLWYT